MVTPGYLYPFLMVFCDPIPLIPLDVLLVSPLIVSSHVVIACEIFLTPFRAIITYTAYHPVLFIFPIGGAFPYHPTMVIHILLFLPH